MELSPLAAARPAPPPTRTFGDLPIGRRTLDSTNDAVVRYRFEGSGPASERTLVPDSPRAHLLAASPAGPRMERALRRIASQVDVHEGKALLHSVVMAPDVDAVAGTWMSAAVGYDHATPLDDARFADLSSLARDYRAVTATMDGKNGAFDADGHIVLMPEYGRSLLASVGAYDPTSTEVAGRNPKRLHAFMPRLMRHELEHSATSATSYGRDPGLDGWEEGVAEALSKALPSTAAARHDLPPTTQYGRGDSRSMETTAGWRPYRLHPASKDDTAKRSNATYGRRHRAVVDSLELAGINVHTRAGYDRARELLQEQSIARVPGRIADAVIAEHDLDPAVRERLRLRLREVTESTERDPVGAIAREFGIDPRP
jgi:hypothetical protein